MAERRMFAKQIIDSDAFLDMSPSAQSLYFHLGMRGDDEGFINSPKKIMRMLGANDDDMRILISKNFVIPFDSGVCVIKHWRIHNYIRNDRLQPTVYQDEREQITLKNNNVYTMTGTCLTSDGQVAEQVRLGKGRLGKVNTIDQIDDDFNSFWSAYPKKQNKGQARKAWAKTNPPLDAILEALAWQVDSDDWIKDGGKFIPHASTYLNAEKWLDEKPKERVPF